MILAKRGLSRLGPLVAGILTVLWLLWRRRKQNRKSAQAGNSRTSASSTVLAGSANKDRLPAGAVPLTLKAEDSAGPHAATAIAWHRNGLRGETFFGEDSGIKLFSAPQNPWLAIVAAVLSLMGHGGELFIVAGSGLAILIAVLLDSFGKYWVFAVAMVTLLFGAALAWVSSQWELEEDKGDKGVIGTAIDIIFANGKNPVNDIVLLHGKSELCPDECERTWQAMLQRAHRPPPPGGHWMYWCSQSDGLRVLVEVDARALASSSRQQRHHHSAAGLLGAFILEEVPAKSTAMIHHYSAASAGLRGPAATAAGASPLRGLLSEARALAKPSGNAASAPTNGASDSDTAALAAAQEALDRATQLSDGSDGGTWEYHSTEIIMKLTKQEAGTRFPIARGIAELSADHVAPSQAGGPHVDALKKAEQVALEIFGLACSTDVMLLIDPTKGEDTLLHWWGPGSNTWLIHSKWKANPLQSAMDGAFLCAVRKRRTEEGGIRLTRVMVPAPSNVVEAHAEKIEMARAGVAYRPQNYLISAFDLIVRPDGNLRVACVLHLNPEVSRLLPTSMLQSLVLSAPCRGLYYVDMVKNLRLPSPLTVQALKPDESDELLEEVHVGGRSIKVSRCLADIFADVPPGSSTPAH